MFTKKLFLFLMAFLLGTLMLTGCQKKQDQGKPDLEQLQKAFSSALTEWGTSHPLDVCEKNVQNGEVLVWPDEPLDNLIPADSRRTALFQERIAFDEIRYDEATGKFTLPVCGLTDQTKSWILETFCSDAAFDSKYFEFVAEENDYYKTGFDSAQDSFFEALKTFAEGHSEDVKLTWTEILITVPEDQQKTNIERKISLWRDPLDSSCVYHVRQPLSKEGENWFLNTFFGGSAPSWLNYTTGGEICSLAEYPVEDLAPSSFQDIKGEENITAKADLSSIKASNVDFFWTVTNNSKETVRIVSAPHLEFQQNDGTWVEVPWQYVNQTYAAPDMAFSLEAGGSVNIHLNLDRYAPLCAGNYRIVQATENETVIVVTFEVA